MPRTSRSSVLTSRPSSVEKAIDILLGFDPQHPQLRLTDISQRLGLHRSMAHRLLSLPNKKRLITADAASQFYNLGPDVVELARVVLRQQDLRTICTPYLERLRQTANETGSLYICMGDCCVCIEELESGQAIKYSQTVGLTAPLHIGAPGKVLLACLPLAELEALLAILQPSVPDGLLVKGIKSLEGLILQEPLSSGIVFAVQYSKSLPRAGAQQGSVPAKAGRHNGSRRCTEHIHSHCSRKKGSLWKGSHGSRTMMRACPGR